MGTSNLIFLISSILLNLPFNTAQICSNSGNSSLNSTFGKNSNRILYSLPFNVTTNKGFFPATPTENFETVYMLALCRGDVSNDTCFVCVNYTSQAILMNCPQDKQTANNGDYPSKCTVRSSNTSFFDVKEKQPPRFISITGVIRFSVDEFDKALHSLVESLIIRAAMGSSTIKFAARETRFAGYMNLYGLMQCLPGISSVDCRRCLRGAVDESRSFCFRERAVNVVRPNCIFQYDLTPSFESSAGAAPLQPVNFTPSRPPTNVTTKEDNKSCKLRAAIFGVVPTSILSVLIGCVFFRLRKRFKSSRTYIPSNSDGNTGLTTFNVATIAEATNNFSRSNKIGEGGFGPVFKGQLSTGQLIAVKRNSEKSSQGLREFTNEVTLIAKLQHWNLVRLLGCCIEGEERMLIYEYMPNGSLNSFIFANRSNPLTWSRRFDIIVGIARGLVYLHRDSRLRIVHRDLKASNVLLDDQMNPKIADFGLARAFRGDQQLEKTGKVVGTYGYMSPEYVMDGLFSMKSDVYSFGVLVLEIVSGKRNREFCHPDHGLTLLGHAWKLWIEGKALEVLHDQMDDFPIPVTLKCIQVGLLCVQQHPEDRPTMSSVLLALDSENATLPQPKQPGFYTERSNIETEPSLSGNRSPTTNEMTLTVLSGR